MTSSVTRSQSNRAHLRYGGAGDAFDGSGTNKYSATVLSDQY